MSTILDRENACMANNFGQSHLNYSSSVSHVYKLTMQRIKDMDSETDLDVDTLFGEESGEVLDELKAGKSYEEAAGILHYSEQLPRESDANTAAYSHLAHPTLAAMANEAMWADVVDHYYKMEY